jgi:hypothetical protein
VFTPILVSVSASASIAVVSAIETSIIRGIEVALTQKYNVLVRGELANVAHGWGEMRKQNITGLVDAVCRVMPVQHKRTQLELELEGDFLIELDHGPSRVHLYSPLALPIG